jgi:hypothetical protein
VLLHERATTPTRAARGCVVTCCLHRQQDPSLEFQPNIPALMALSFQKLKIKIFKKFIKFVD